MKFAICAGHGGNDPGACYAGYTERDLMVKLRDKVCEHLIQMGHTVKTDGTKGVNLPLTDAILLAKQHEISVELHTNAAANPAAKGVEVLSLPKSKVLSQKLAKSISSVLHTPLRGEQGWKPQESSARGKLGFVQAGGMIVEVFFLSNPEELSSYLASEDLLAEKIAHALIE